MIFNSFDWGYLLPTVIALAATWIYWSTKRPNRSPPQSSASYWVNFQYITRGFDRVLHTHRQGLEVLSQSKQQSKYGTVFEVASVTSLFKPFYYVTDYKLAKTVLLGDKKRGIQESIKNNVLSSLNFVDKKVSNIFTARSLDNNREIARKHMAPSFSVANLQGSIQCLDENIEEVFKLFRSYEEKDEVFDMKNISLSLFLSSLTKSAFDFEFSMEYNKLQEERNRNVLDGTDFLKEQETAFHERVSQIRQPWKKYLPWTKSFQRGEQACQNIAAVGAKVLNAKREKLRQMKETTENHRDKEEKEEVKRMTIIERLLEHPYPSEEARISDLLILIFAGHDTSANTFMFLLYEMAKNPEAVSSLQKELDTAFPSENDHITWEKVSHLPYLSYCVKEAMRLWPVAASGSSRTLVSDILYEGYVIPKGSVCQTFFYSMFRQPWIREADEFIPSRWDEAAIGSQAVELNEMLMPFSLGKRNCIGQNLAKMQLHLLAANFFRHFTFELMEEPPLRFMIVLSPKKLLMKVKARKTISNNN